MKTNTKTLAASALFLSLAGTAASADIAVQLNGQPLATSVSPLQVGGRTLVPMRDIFEALGAQLTWNPVAQTITAQKDLTRIQLAINNPNALVNGRNVRLEQPATLVNGRTFVPLRFVAEATGAQVDWNGPMQLVSIRSTTAIAQNPNSFPANPVNQFPTNQFPSNQLPAQGTQVAEARTISVPDGAVIPVSIDQTLSSATSRVGQTFTATVISKRLGDSEFPAGTKIEGRVIEARASENNQPGILDLDWQTAVLPNGTRVPLRGELTSLDTSNVQMTGGRIVANGAQKNDRLKVIGIGAGAGFVLGRVLKTNSTLTAILGAAGGYLFGRTRDRKAEEAIVAANTTLGVRLNDAVRYADTGDYFGYRSNFLRVADNPAGRFDPNYYGFDEASAVPLGNRQGADRYAGYDYADRLPAPAMQNQGALGVGDIYPDDRTGVNTTGDNRAVAGFQQIAIPAGAVVPVTLDRELSSATARVGEEFTATVVSQRLGDSEFPVGSKIEGRIVEARRQEGTEPGVLDLEFRSAILPDGTRVPLRGQVIALDDNDIQNQNGRIVAKSSARGNDRLKVIGIGAAAGFVVGRLLKKDGLLPSILGALGGYVFSTQRGDKPAEAVVAQNTRLGVRLDSDVRYADATGYSTYRAQFLRQG